MTTHEYLEEWLIDNRVPTFNEFDTARRKALAVEKKLVTDMLPERTFVRPLLVVVPRPGA